MDYLNITDDLKNKVLKFYEVTEDDIERDVEILNTWYKQQPHFPPLPVSDPVKLLERMLLWNQFRVERTKQKIESLLAISSEIGIEFFTTVCNMIPSEEPSILLPLPRVSSKTHERLCFWTIKDTNINKYSLERDIQQSFLVQYCLLQFDYASGTRVIVDVRNVTLAHVKLFNPLTFSRYLNAYLMNMNRKLHGLEFVNVNSTVSTLISFLKTLFPAKLAARIVLHSDYESLRKSVPPECLPKDLGGELESVETLSEQWYKCFMENREEVLKLINLHADESLRPEDSPYGNKDLGIQGTFKKLNID